MLLSDLGLSRRIERAEGQACAEFAEARRRQFPDSGAEWMELGGASTIPELRRRGLQSALLRERLRYAFDHGCDLAVIAAEAGSNSQRNAERKGFRIAYTRTKWRLVSGAHPK
jgi:GNAT superfamily N-acetyltransferase